VSENAGRAVPSEALLEFPDSLDIGNASRNFEDEQGNVSPTHSFQAGARWMMEEVKARNNSSTGQEPA